MADWLKKLVLARNKAVFVADWLKKLVLARNKAVFVADCLSLKKVDSQKARINVYLSNTEERTVL